MTEWSGLSVQRGDAVDKAKGATRYIADIEVLGMWHAATVRSPTARGKLLGLRFDPAFDWSAVAVVTAADIPGINAIAMIQKDMPCLVHDQIAYLGEPVAVIAAPSLDLARAAVRAVSVDVLAQEPQLGIAELARRYAQDPSSVEVIAAVDIAKGDVARGFALSAEIAAADYFTDPQEHAYLEPQRLIAFPQGLGVRILGSLQCPYYVRPAVAAVLDLAAEKVVVAQAPIGGAFGGKEDYPSLLAAHAALLARKLERPVRLVLSREEDMAFTTKRHASFSRLRTGASRDGTLLAMESDFFLDAGAYTTLSPVVLSRGAIHATSAYRFPHLVIRARALRSNTPPAGAFRGFGAPQSHFAIEAQLDELAAKVGIDPLSLRRKNALEIGDATGTRQVLKESVSAHACLEAVARACDYTVRRAAIEKANAARPAGPRRGLGLALFWHGGGFTGSGERKIAARVALALFANGEVEIRVSSTEMGQGACVTLRQIAADSCGIDIAAIGYLLPDTSRVPDSGPTVASRTTMVVGKVLERCGALLVSAIEQRLAARRQGEGFATADGVLTWAEAAAIAAKDEELVVEATYEHPPDIEWDEEHHRGDAYAVYSYGAVAVEIEIEPVTFSVTAKDVWCAFDMGRAINPFAAEGQIEGGLMQALGWALMEHLSQTPRGELEQRRFQNYIVPTSADAPNIHVELISAPSKHGPSGAKGLGELPMNGLGPAVVNAIRHAQGVFVRQLPATPERIAAAVGGHHAK